MEDNFDFFIKLFDKQYDRELQIKSSVESRSGIMIALIGTMTTIILNGIDLKIDFSKTDLNFMCIFVNLLKIIIVISIFILLLFSFIKFCSVLTTNSFQVIDLSEYQEDITIESSKLKQMKLDNFNECLDSIVKNNNDKCKKYKQGIKLIELTVTLITALGIFSIFI
ncbi:hypothetical protein [Clostridium sp.]|uniref:hypothetical protein n=1 Tax=Clostridium sp. TaxID=1506 RepID=UPI00290DF95E|nr:hypothetical protein [Clostridium sp.]MDU6519372.1 hypothetical protein [Clostridium sp.]